MYYDLEDKKEQLNRIEMKIDNKPFKKYYDIKAASAFSSLSVSTIRRAVAKGELKCSRKSGKLLFTEVYFRKWLGI